MRRHPIEHRTVFRVFGAAQLRQVLDLLHQKLVALVPHRTVGKELRQPTGCTAQHGAQAVGGLPADPLRRHVRRPLREEGVQCRPGNEPALEERRQPFARARHTELGEDKSDVGIGPRLPGENSQA